MDRGSFSVAFIIPGLIFLIPFLQMCLQRIQEHKASSLALLLMSWTSRLLASKLLWTDEIFSTPPGPETRPWHNYREKVVRTDGKKR